VARPPSTNPATEQIRLRVTPEEKTALKLLAQSEGLTLSRYLVKCGLQAQPGKEKKQ